MKDKLKLINKKIQLFLNLGHLEKDFIPGIAGVQPGDFRRNLLYNKNRIFAFVMALGEVTDEWYATAAGAINYGFPVIADSDIPQILPTGVCTYEHVVSNIPYDQIVEKSIEVRGLKVKVTEIDIPVSVSPAFEGERIRKDEMRCEFGGQRTPAFEWLRMREINEMRFSNPYMGISARHETL